MCLIAVGISALACKDPGKPAGTGTGTPVTPGSAAPARAHEGPTLPADDHSDHPSPSDAWGGAIEKSIAAAAPELEKVSCADFECKAMIAGDSEGALATKSAALQSEDSLRSLGAQSIVFGAPETKNGRLTLPVTIAFER
jgi:hypothetical protein